MGRFVFQLHGLVVALIIGPLAAVAIALVITGQIDGREAMAAILSVIPGAIYVLWLYRRQWRSLSGHLKRLADRQPRISSDHDMPVMPELHRLSRRIAQQDVVFDAIPNPVLLIAADRQVVAANQAAVRLLGRRVVGRDVTLALRQPGVLAAIDRALVDNSAGEVEFTIKGGVERIFEARITPFAAAIRQAAIEADGQEVPFASVLVILHDITTMRRSEQMRADFVANASHELRTPLASLLGFIETLRGPAQNDPEAQSRFLKIMAEQAGRMARLVEELLTLSRIEIDEHHRPTDVVGLEELLQNLVSTLENRAAQRGMVLVLELADALPQVMGDRDQLIQMFQNLIDNAISYASADTTVTIRASLAEPDKAAFLQSQPMVAVAVIDQGPGIPREHLSRLTERFYRVDAARSRAAGGTGLGLAIVKHIINRHRGRLMIDSTLGKGSVFTLYLPCQMAQMAVMRPVDSALP